MKILVCTAGVESSKDILTEVKNVIEGLKAEKISVLNVLPHESTIPPKELKKRGREATDIILKALSDIGVEASRELRFSEDVAEEIVETSDEMDSNLIVLGVGDKPGWLRMIRGDVVEKVVHEASCPVLVLPKSPEREMFEP